MTARIEDYAMIGDCRTAAIICRNGSIDWFCVPRFDSGAVFAALLGTRDNGRWLIEPAAKKFNSRRRYRSDSLILETIFTTATGKARVTDFMPPDTPESAIVRIVEAVEGHVDMHTELVIRFDYGVTIPWVSRRDSRTMAAVAGPHLLTFRTRADVRGENMHSVADFTVKKGTSYAFVWLMDSPSGRCPSPSIVSSPWRRPNATGDTGRQSARRRASGATPSCARC